MSYLRAALVNLVLDEIITKAQTPHHQWDVRVLNFESTKKNNNTSLLTGTSTSTERTIVYLQRTELINFKIDKVTIEI
jgi:hypothetical protein